MAKQIINIGTSPNKGDGDPIRTAMTKINANFTELYDAIESVNSTLDLGSFEFTGNTITTDDSSRIEIAQEVRITSDLTMRGSIIPEIDNQFDLGDPNNQWRSLYVSGSTIYIGGNALSINDQGELTYNDNRVAHEAGEFMTLDNLSDLNVGDPNAGDTIAWAGSQWVNVPLTQDRLADDGDELILVGGANPYVTFPAITGGDQLQISGAEVTALSGNLALTGQSTVTIISNAAGVGGGSNYFTFAANGTLMFPDGSLALTDSVLNNGLDADIKGSVFADDSTLMIDAVDNKIYATELTVAVGNFVNVNSNNVDVENINGLASQINFTVGGYNNLVIENNLVTIQNVSLSVAGDITLGGGLTSNTDINITVDNDDSSTYTWNFGSDGNLTLPNDAVIRTDGSNVEVGDITNFNVEAAGVVNIYTDTDGETPFQWQFGDDGSLAFPGGMTIETEYGGGARLVIDGKQNYVDIRSDGNILIGYNESGGTVVIGNGTSGQVDILGPKFRVTATVPTSSTGADGDMVGMIAVGGGYLYVCTANWVSPGSANIWTRTLLTTGAW
jgi:hypothetical protein